APLAPAEELPLRAPAGEAARAEEASAARRRERPTHHVALRETADAGADLDDDAHALVPHDRAVIEAFFSLVVGVEIGAAHAAGAHRADGVEGVLDARVGHVAHFNATESCEDRSLHGRGTLPLFGHGRRAKRREPGVAALEPLVREDEERGLHRA